MSNTHKPTPPRSFDLEDIEAMQERQLSMKTDPAMERLAVLFVANCFRNTVLEDYHADWPEFTDELMKALMQEAVNKLSTALHVVFTGDQTTRDAALEVLSWHWPSAWDDPEFDQGMLRVIELTKQARKKANKRGR